MSAVFPPVLLQVALSIALLVLLAGVRVAETMRDAKIKAEVLKGRSDVYSRNALLIADNFRNQFELPVLFYLAVVFAVLIGPVSDSFVTLAWIFAISRVVHSLIHCSVNIIPLRFTAFGVGLIVVLMMWFDLYTSIMGG